MSSDCKCSHGAVGWSAVCDCGISWPYSLFFKYGNIKVSSHRIGRNTIERIKKPLGLENRKHATGDKWQSKTLFLAIFDPRSWIVKSVFDCCLSGVVEYAKLY